MTGRSRHRKGGPYSEKLRRLGEPHVREVVFDCETRQEAADRLGVSYDALKHFLKAEGWRPPKDGAMVMPPDGSDSPIEDIALPSLPSGDYTYEELRAMRLREFARVDQGKKARELIKAIVHRNGPICLHFFGDPHVDDSGCDFGTLIRHTEIVRDTDGMYACNIGDTTNNWVGRLQRLYADQSITAQQAWTLAEGWIKELEGKWLFIIGGNHDVWKGAGDPLKWICKDKAHYEPHSYRVALCFPNGREVIVNARHDWPGHSQWNPTHGPQKAAELGFRDDIYIAGHKHTSGYQQLKVGDGSICNAARVASYKIHDEFASSKGLRDLTISPCICFVIDPENDGPDGIKQFWDPEPAARYLRMLQGAV